MIYNFFHVYVNNINIPSTPVDGTNLGIHFKSNKLERISKNGKSKLVTTIRNRK